MKQASERRHVAESASALHRLHQSRGHSIQAQCGPIESLYDHTYCMQPLDVAIVRHDGLIVEGRIENQRKSAKTIRFTEGAKETRWDRPKPAGRIRGFCTLPSVAEEVPLIDHQSMRTADRASQLHPACSMSRHNMTISSVRNDRHFISGASRSSAVTRGEDGETHTSQPSLLRYHVR